jgi:glycyl-tRNA synthetase
MHVVAPYFPSAHLLFFSANRASGHVAKFADLMVRDVSNGACFRADHLLEHWLDALLKEKKTTPEQAAEYKLVQATCGYASQEEMARLLKKYNVKAPETNNDITAPEYFNLMFRTNIGPIGSNIGFLRPETAQGIFVNFKRLLEYNGNQLPFAGAQIGQAYRNEISPRSGLLRVREFTLAEIEHFVNPEDKRHPRFKDVAHLTLTLYPRDRQTTNSGAIEVNLGEAVKKVCERERESIDVC